MGKQLICKKLINTISFIDEEENCHEENTQILCENCNVKFSEKEILQHIGRISKKCKLYYGPRYNEMKENIQKERDKRRKRKIRDINIFFLINVYTSNGFYCNHVVRN